jgi:hypothetical protein
MSWNYLELFPDSDRSLNLTWTILEEPGRTWTEVSGCLFRHILKHSTHPSLILSPTVMVAEHSTYYFPYF